ncbi:MAG TPA: MBL fold metallo-hydrolase [Bacteroidales bacterium]|jgi:phosphoribosyl 1,2-cyclic phosphate phosphodiesterase|nr:MBL fold metallo-hydrolase [Bacteroidales bacterium]MDI9573404.1 MBL fold metallo-hydrolase [Bacteroidota bacterium]MBP9511430.1 MBL fold metallo-hydrolase [Bacteroidales bacterium]MBP9587949.1 MBL fold metallo-hydrolase [Bacteroidales bacterium]HOE58821.1 MBL fold metallo-hydrolase [Bacteroidales bacterium]
MRITFLGTGTSQGVPVIACECDICTSTDPRDRRLRSSVLIQEGAMNIVIDAGPDFRCQMLRAGIKTLRAVLITHGHKDHIAGLDDVRPFNYFTHEPIDVYAAREVQEDIRRDFFYAFDDDKYPGIPEIELHTIDYSPFSIDKLEVIPFELWHNRLKILGFRIGDFAYITDASYIPEISMQLLTGLDVLVINALRLEPHVAHFNLPQALDIIHRLSPRSAFLTHISHRLGKHGEIERILPPYVSVAYDGLEIEIDKS